MNKNIWKERTEEISKVFPKSLTMGGHIIKIEDGLFFDVIHGEWIIKVYYSYGFSKDRIKEGYRTVSIERALKLMSKESCQATLFNLNLFTYSKAFSI